VNRDIAGSRENFYDALKKYMRGNIKLPSSSFIAGA
jgi:hypothetical protein